MACSTMPRAGARRRPIVAAVRELVSAGVDVVHMHGVDFSSYLPDEGPALLATLHLPSDYYPREVFSLGRPRTRLVCVSEHQLATCPRADLPLCVVPNGVNLDEFAPILPKESFVLAMGPICPEKGFHDALDAAKEADIDMILAGEVFTYPGHLRYFSEAIEPRLDARRRFVGPVGGAEKRSLLARARCLLVPSLVAETSSLVTMEALASGTPVIARPAGALADLVEQGKTGYLVSSVEEMSSAIAEVAAIDSAWCRQTGPNAVLVRAHDPGLRRTH